MMDDRAMALMNTVPESKEAMGLMEDQFLKISVHILRDRNGWNDEERWNRFTFIEYMYQ